MALQLLGVDDEKEVIGQSILGVLDIRQNYSIRDLVENEQAQNEVILDGLTDDTIISASFSPIQRESRYYGSSTRRRRT